MAKKRLSNGRGHSLPGDRREKDRLGRGKRVTERRALTNWGPQVEGQVRTRKERNRVRGTHKLETTEGETSQGTERK